MTVWDDLVGQERVSEVLTAAARDADALVTAAAADQPLPETSKRFLPGRAARQGPRRFRGPYA